jgi:hypothetical protein
MRKEMMEGIHIFNQVDITELQWSWYLPMLLVELFIFIFALSILDKCERFLIKAVCFIICIISGTAFMISGCAHQVFEQPTGKHEYTVTLDDDKIKLLEFNEKYEIVRQEGDLWIIRDK